MERTITHLVPRVDTVLGVVIGWQGRVTLTQDGVEAMNIIECRLPQSAWRALDTWTHDQAVDALAAALDAPPRARTGNEPPSPADQMRQLVQILQSRVRYPLLEQFRFPEA
jgi:hypothetical protein